MNLLRLVRVSSGYTLKELSKEIGLSFQKLSAMENGTSSLDKESKLKIEKRLNVCFDYDTKEDLQIRKLFDRLIDSVFFGSLNFDDIYQKIIAIEANKISSKYLYLLPIMKYIIAIITKEFTFDDKDISRYIKDDQNAYCLYLAYKATIKSAVNYENSIKMINEALHLGVGDKRLEIIALYQLCFVYVDNYKLIDALETLNYIRGVFTDHGSYIRIFECDLLIADIYYFLGYDNKAIRLMKSMIKRMDNIILPTHYEGLMRRNIALCYIDMKDYEKALIYLKENEEFEDDNNTLILYFIYAYALKKDYANADSYLRKAERRFKDRMFLEEIKFWKIVVSSEEHEQDSRLISKINSVLKSCLKINDYEKYLTYLDISSIIYTYQGDYKSAYDALRKRNDFVMDLINR